MEDIHQRLAEWRVTLKNSTEKYVSKITQTATEKFSADAYIFNELPIATQIGKGWRGSLCLLSAESFGDKNLKTAAEIAGIIELTHYALLIHDDIIDNTPIRRGTLSFPARLTAIYDGRGVLTPKKHSLGVAIALGDYLLQHIFKSVNSLEVSGEINNRINQLFCDQLEKTTRAQLYDAAVHEPITDVQAVIRLYEEKTGAYSFVLPLLAGYALNRWTDEKVSMSIQAIGNSLGVIMQALDDLAGFNENGNYANLAEDIINKQPSLWCALLLPELNRTEKEKFNYIYWLDQIPRVQLDYVRDLFDKYKINKKITGLIKVQTELCHDLIHDLPIAKQQRRLWHQFVVLAENYSGV